MKKIKLHPYLLISSIITLIIGLWLIFTDYHRIINFIYFIVGGGLIITGISKLLVANYNQKSYFYDGITNIVIGILIMFVHNLIVTIILGLAFIVFPLIRIYNSNDRKYAFKRELPLLIIGLVIALSGDLIANIFVKILGGLFILLAIYLFLNIFLEKISYIKFYKTTNNKNLHSQDNVIDVEFEEGDGDE